MAGTPSVINLTLISLLAVGLSPGAARAQTVCDTTPRALEANSTTLHYFECGKGEPLVFVHGALGDLHTFSASLPPLSCDALRKLKRPTLLVTGERSPALFFLVTAELEHCLIGESQVMVPEAGHGIHADNAPFYNEAVLDFLRRR